MKPGWQRVKLGEVCSFKYGQMPDKTDLVAEGYPVFSGYRVVGRSKRYHYADPEIIVVARGVGGTGDIKMSPPFCFLTNLSIAVLLSSPNVDKKFLFYRLLSTSLWSLRTGSAQAQITIERLRDYQVDLPPLDIQRRIAGILTAYDDLIDNNARRIAMLEEMSNLALSEALKPAGQLPQAGQLPKSATLPPGWRLCALSDLAVITMGQSPPSAEYGEDGDGIPFHQGVTDFESYFHTNRLFCRTVTKPRIAQEGDILFSVRAPVARLALALDQMALGRGLASIRPTQSKRNFVWAYLRLLFPKPDMFGGGTIYKAVNKDDVHNVPIVVPADAIVEAFEQLADPVWSLIKNLYVTNCRLADIQKLILPRLIYGDLEVTKAPSASTVIAA